MKITAQDLLDLMPIVKDRGWRVDGLGWIRDAQDRCPICALAYEISNGRTNYLTFYKAAARHGWGAIGGAKRIANAADNPKNPLRPALMQALGMT